MTRHTIMPLTMGFGMGLMMLWMLHNQLTSAGVLGFTALATFIGAHILLVLVAVAVPLWVATRIPRLHRLLSRAHLPNHKHMVLMVLGAVIAAGTTHLALHGGLI